MPYTLNPARTNFKRGSTPGLTQAAKQGPQRRQMSTKKDRLFAQPLQDVPKFTFDGQVAAVFPDMIKRSVPGYSTILHMIGQMAERYARPGTVCYDLGCSLGASLLAMRGNIHCSDVNIIGVDNSEEMLERCRQIVASQPGNVPVELKAADITEVSLEPASICVLNFTLQFIAKHERAALLDKIARALVSGGVLILSEKLSFEDTEHDALMTDLHHDFKRMQGYSDLEIAQKREAIEHILVPESLEIHRQRLLNAGFRSANIWFQCFNFASIIAFR